MLYNHLKLSRRLFFFGDDDFEGEGTLVDISTRGCRVSSSITVQPEMLLKLSLFLPDYNWPARVDEAIVRWVQGQGFGVEFTTIRPSMRKRILMLMMKAKP
ncbi:MAG: PilZ domain-containing protein [Nitrospiraceae bacterium]